MRTLRIILAAIAVWFAAMPAMADEEEVDIRWLRAESANFIVYSDGEKDDLLDSVRRLEILDAVMRQSTGVPIDMPTPLKLPVYLVRDGTALQRVRPQARRRGTYYVGTGSHTFALAVRSRLQSGQPYDVYIQHFLRLYHPHAYPEWYNVGLAAYFSAIDIDHDQVTIGLVDGWRGDQLTSGANWMSVADLVSLRPDDVPPQGERLAMYYAEAWLLTHWFRSHTGRAHQLDAYLAALDAGGDPVSSLEQATGMPVDQLDRALRVYAHDSLTAMRFPVTADEIEIVVTELPPAYDDLLLPSASLAYGHEGDDAEALIEDIRRGAALHPHDPFARLTLAIGEFRFGDRALGVRWLEALVAENPGDLEALHYLALARNMAAFDVEGPERFRLLSESSSLLARALAINPSDYRTYVALGRNRQFAPDYPTGNDLETWRIAYQLAPHVTSIGLDRARALMRAGHFDEAIRILAPIAARWYGSSQDEVADELIALARQGLPPPPADPSSPWTRF